jgi:predicted RNA-binding protein with PIN domain
MGGPMSEPVPTTLLRPALEAALRVARAGEEADPVEPAPASLRRYLTFSRLPAAALSVVRRTVDDDADFRQRVVEASSEADVGEVGWTWLTRAEGWEDRLAEMADADRRRRNDATGRRTEQSTLRQVAALEEALRRAEATAARHAEQSRKDREELDAERGRRRDAETRIDALGAELARVAEVEAAAEAQVARLTAERDDLRRQVVALREQLRRGEDRPAPMPVDIDRSAVARSIADAVAALNEAARQLDAAPTPARAAQRRRTAAGVPSAPGRRRAPVKLPGGVLDDSVQAAEHLVRAANALLLVDGYNVSNAIWPGQPLGDQRVRLVDALNELQARTGTAIEVVFDGAEVSDPWVPGARSRVQVRFSPPDVEADDVLIDLIAAQPPERPVVLATSDRGLRDRARRLGANLIGARQLLGAMRR